MHAGGLAALLLCAASLGAAATLPQRSVHGPEPGHTGGFGEPTCRACHFDGPEQPTDAAVRIDGLPAAWTPGARYPVTVVVRGATLRRGGFQLSARRTHGEQAGTLAGPAGIVAVTEAAGIAYSHHVQAGTAPTARGEVSWELVWTAPLRAAGSVVFHVAANAANDDDSEFGDLIVTAVETVPPAQD